MNLFEILHINATSCFFITSSNMAIAFTILLRYYLPLLSTKSCYKKSTISTTRSGMKFGMFFFRRKVYFDNNSTTPVHKSVRKVINRILKNNFANPSSLYYKAFDSATLLEESRKEIALSINANKDEIIFTGSASEANNTVIKVLGEKNHALKNHALKKKIISTPIEHPSVIEVLDYLSKTSNTEIVYLPVDKHGFINPDDLEKFIDDNTFLVISMLANNELGTIQDIEKVSVICQKQGIPILCDCVQALGKIPVDVKALGVDYAVISAHKIGGPKGVGALYVKGGAYIAPFIHGGHQENGLRAGTESIHNIAGFAQALKGIDLSKNTRILKLKKQLEEGIIKIYPNTIINSPKESSLNNTINLTFPGQDNGVIIGFLGLYGIAVSAGSACNTTENKPSHVLLAIGLTANESRSSIRLSISANTKAKDIRYFLKIMDKFFHQKRLSIGMIFPGQIDETFLNNQNLIIVDVRYEYERKGTTSFSNSYEYPFFSFRKHHKTIPKDKEILLVCQVGMSSPIVAFYLRSKGYKNVSFIATGIYGWTVSHPELRERLTGNNITRIQNT